MTSEDLQLVQQSIQGNTEAFSRLVGRYAHTVYMIAYSRLNNTQDAEDVAQEVFVKAWYNLNKLENPDKFGNWLNSITRNASEDWARKKKPYVELEESILVGNAANFTEEAIMRRENHRKVWIALEELDEKYRLISTLYYIGGYSAKEICRLMNLNISLVESRLRRAKTMLKKELVELAEQTITDHALGTKFVTKVMDRIVKDFTLEIPVKDIEQSVEWYVKYLGFDLIPPVLGIAELKLDSGIRICLFRPDQTDESSYWYVKDADNYRVRVCLRVSDIEQLHKNLSESGAKVSSIEGGPGCGWTFHFHDINGNKLIAWSGYTKEHA